MNGSSAELVPLYDSVTGSVQNLPLILKSEEEWSSLLSPASFAVTRRKGTETAFSGVYHAIITPGLYRCICCGTDLFVSDDKFDSGSGWPSFTRPVSDLNVTFGTDSDYGMKRTEVVCRRCGAHLGHVFDDGPAPAGLRFCINSLSLTFIPR